MKWTIARNQKDKPLQHCNDALKDIIDQCILRGTYWGGVWSFNDENYTISNRVYPGNPFADARENPPSRMRSTGTAYTQPPKSIYASPDRHPKSSAPEPDQRHEIPIAARDELAVNPTSAHNPIPDHERAESLLKRQNKAGAIVSTADTPKTALGSAKTKTCVACEVCKFANIVPMPLPTNLGDIPRDYFKNLDAKSQPREPANPTAKLTDKPIHPEGIKAPRKTGLKKRLHHSVNCGIHYSVPSVPSDNAARSSAEISKWWTKEVFLNTANVYSQELYKVNRPKPGSRYRRKEIFPFAIMYMH